MKGKLYEYVLWGCLWVMVLFAMLFVTHDVRKKHAINKLRNSVDKPSFRNNNDIWMEHVMSYCDDASLSYLANADRRRHNISATMRQLRRKQSMERYLLCAVQEWITPRLDRLVLDVNASTLMPQILHGFDGIIDYVLSDVNQQKSWINSKQFLSILGIKCVLDQYAKLYGDNLSPVHWEYHLHARQNATLNRFIEFHKESRRLNIRFMALFEQELPQYYQSVVSISASVKLDMEAVAVALQYPNVYVSGMMCLQRVLVWKSKQVWKENAGVEVIRGWLELYNRTEAEWLAADEDDSKFFNDLSMVPGILELLQEIIDFWKVFMLFVNSQMLS